jgi:hypothetical protein
VTSSRKLILASTLVAGGYAVALLLGSISNWLWPDANRRGTVAEDPWAQSALNRESGAANNRIVGARLMPESAANRRETIPAASASPPPTWLVSSLGPPAGELPSSPSTADAPTSPEQDKSDLIGDSPSPWARITNVKSRQESSTSDASPWDRWPRWDPNLNTAASVDDPPHDPPTAVAAFDQAAPLETHAVQVSYDNSPAPDPQTAPPDSSRQNSLQPIDPSGDLRTHILIDGDSLAKLADRYLDDPALGDEIFRLNRDVLDNPELLPIGVELRIPNRRAVANRQAASVPLVKTADPAEPVRLPPVDKQTGGRSGSARPELLAPERPTWTPAFGTGT